MTTLIETTKTHIFATWIDSGVVNFASSELNKLSELIDTDEMINFLLKKGNPFASSFMDKMFTVIEDNFYILEMEPLEAIKTLNLIYDATIDNDIDYNLNHLVEFGRLEIAA